MDVRNEVKEDLEIRLRRKADTMLFNTELRELLLEAADKIEFLNGQLFASEGELNIRRKEEENGTKAQWQKIKDAAAEAIVRAAEQGDADGGKVWAEIYDGAYKKTQFSHSIWFPGHGWVKGK